MLSARFRAPTRAMAPATDLDVIRASLDDTRPIEKDAIMRAARFLAWIAATATTIPALADAPIPSAARAVKTASLERVTSPSSQQRVAFRKRAAHVGDEVEQSLALEVRLSTMKRQGAEIIDKSQTTARNEQHRVMKTTHVENGMAVAVRVQYIAAARELSTPNAAQPGQVQGDPKKTPLPVAGKTYLCQRLPGPNGRLAITDEAGNIPPTDEYEIVAQHMEMVGRPNPLAEFLAGKNVQVGQTLHLPREVADKIFNLGEQFGEITRFDLTLKVVELRGGSTLAQFTASVEAAASNTSQMRMQLEGPLTIEADTCRALNLDLAGPIAMSETRGSYSNSYHVLSTGSLKTHIASQFREAKR